MSERPDYDAIVIGAGHNGMICALYLARARRRVLVLEAADSVGGAARTVDFEGEKIPYAARLDYGLDRQLLADLGLERHGFAWSETDIGSSVFDADGSRIDYALDRDDNASLRTHDAAQWPQFRRRMLRFAGIIGDIAGRIPPRLGSGDGADTRAWLGIAWKLRKLGRDDMREFLRIGAINVFDVLEEHFDDPLFKAALAAEAVIGHGLAPRSPNSVLTLLMRWSGSGGATAMPKGGMSTFTEALRSACELRGVTFRLASPVRRIVVENDHAAGVELASGQVITAPTVVSNADPHTTCMDLIGAAHLDTGFVRRLHNIRAQGCTARMDFLLDNISGLAGSGSPHSLRRRLIYAPDMDYIERAYNDSKYGRVSREPLVELTFPTLLAGSPNPGHRHIASALVQYAPYRLREDAETARRNLVASTRDIIERMVPGLVSRIGATRLLMPTDVEQDLGTRGGHWHQAEIALDQFFMLRPAPELARYRTPLAGVWLCGAGCHPGGGINGLPGRNAARRILATE